MATKPSMLKLHDSCSIPTSIDTCFEAFPRFEFVRDDRLLITEGLHLAAIYDLSTKQPLKSWTFPEIKQLTCPVVFDRTRRKIVSVQGHGDIRIFSENEEYDSEASDRYRFVNRIACVLGNEGGEPIVVYEDGSLNFLTEAVERRAEKSNRDILNGESIILVKSLTQDGRRGDEPTVDVIIITADKDSCLIYNKLRMDKATQIVDLVTSFKLPSDLIVYNINELGTFGGVTRNGDIVIMNDLIVKRPFTLPNFDSASAKKLRGFSFFPGLNGDVVSVIDSTPQITVVDLRYGMTETRSFPTCPITNGVSFDEDEHMVNLSPKGIFIYNYSVQSVSLASMLAKNKVTEDEVTMPSSTNDFLKKLKEEVFPFSSEKLLAAALLHILKQDPKVKLDKTSQLLNVILSTPFHLQLLTKELRELYGPGFPTQKVLQLMMVLIDRFDEEDSPASSDTNIDLVTVLLDSCFKDVLMKRQQLHEFIKPLWDRVEYICNYYSTAGELKAVLESIVPCGTQVSSPSKATDVSTDEPKHKKAKLSEKHVGTFIKNLESILSPESTPISSLEYTVETIQL